MAENGMLSPADVAALSSNNGFGGFEGLIYLAVIASMFGGWGGFGFGGNAGAAAVAGNLATQNDVQRGFDNQNLQAQTRDILGAVTNGTAQAVAATNQTFHDSLSAMQSLYNETARDIAALQVGQAQSLANQNECCCTTKQLILEKSAATDAAIAESKYESAMQMAQMEARLTAKMDANKIEDLQNQVNQLQLAQATSGMLKFPNSWSYGAGPFPPIFGGCCGQGNI